MHPLIAGFVNHEGLVMLAEHSQAGQLYPLLYELIGTGPVVLWPIFRFTNTIAGIAAAAARQWESAEDHFQIAMRQALSSNGARVTDPDR